MRRKLLMFAGLAAAVIAVGASPALAAPDASTGAYGVGLISDVGKFNDKSFNQSALEGGKRAQTELGVTLRPIESKAASDYIPNLTTCARRSQLCIPVGFLLADATNTVAKKFPKVQFAIIDYSVNAPPFKRNKNVTGITFDTNENGYLVGCMAALMVSQGRTPAGTAAPTGAPVISAVGGIKIPTVDIWIAGYRAGARKCVPGTKVLVNYSQDFVAQDKCKEIALDHIAQGAKAIFQVAGGCGLGALDAAKEAGVWGIGVDRDQAFLGKHILTSGVKRVDVSVFLTIKRGQAGERLGGFDLKFNLKNSGVGIGKTSSKVTKAILARVDELKKQIIAGTIKPPKTL